MATVVWLPSRARRLGTRIVARLGIRARRCRRGRAGVMIVVSFVWGLAFTVGALVLLPVPVAPARAVPARLAEGARARIRQPGLSWWPIPVERAAFDAYQRGFRESDDGAMGRAFGDSEWIPARHAEAVRIVTVDADAIEVELLEGAYAGRRGWLKATNLQP